MEALKEISQSLQKTVLPLPTYMSNIAQYIDIIKLQAYQLDSKIVFVLEIPLVDPEIFTLYQLYSIPILDNQTGFHHILSTIHKYIARDDDSISYVLPMDTEKCNQISQNQRMCTDILPYPIDTDAICEAQLLKPLSNLPKTCQMSMLLAQGYNVQEIDRNLWLLTISDPLPVTIKCARKDVTTRIIKTNSILRLIPECIAFIGSTRIHAKDQIEKYTNITYRSHPVNVPYRCCDHFETKSHLSKLKPLKLSKINVDDLNIAQHKLDQYSEELDYIMSQSFIEEHLPLFTISTLSLIIILVILYLCCKYRTKIFPKIAISLSQDQPPTSAPRRNSIRQKLQSLTSFRRRPNVQQESEEEAETPISL
ncbi:uncharacterized protein LOC126885487 [Diabrotica virgifera virgifera]|uniref:Envelope fusion protein n=1 Tax=Diabrotica virgifera virgifera TaxID=50390 RepID=A0ABM5KCV1_DIAVI|nr:uncharacterized protein LOC126885487 [Diabrotica virgifera virgifera]